MVTHKGGCHCGRVRFEVEAPADGEVTDCNCSIFRLVQGDEGTVRGMRVVAKNGRNREKTYAR